jgi:acetylornithine deacetylase/succinyl-diaminopimelate desuccinylase-like protein
MKVKIDFKNLFSRIKGSFKGKPSSLASLKQAGRYSPIVTRILSDAMLFNEIPSPTEKEELRIEFILRKFSEFGIYEPYQDDFGNVAAVFPASRPADKYVLLFTDIGTEQFSPVDSLVRLTENRAEGMGIADESLGVAALLNLAEWIQKESVAYQMNVICLFTNLSEENGEFRALEHFIHFYEGQIAFALYVGSINQGNLESKPLGHYKLAVRVSTPEQEVMNVLGGTSSVTVLSNIAFQLGNIQWDRESDTVLNIARIDAGIGFGYYPNEGVLELEMYSGNPSVLDMMKNTITATIQKIASETRVEVEIRVLSYIPVGNPELNTSLLVTLKEVYSRLKIPIRSVSLPDKTAFLNSFQIPAATVGISVGKKSRKEEYVEIAPIEAGFKQLPLFLDLSIEAEELKEE